MHGCHRWGDMHRVGQANGAHKGWLVNRCGEVHVDFTPFVSNTQDDTDSSLRPMSRRMAQASRSPVGSNLQSLFQGHPMVISHMVPTLLRLYVDVEFTDQHNQVWSVRRGWSCQHFILRFSFFAHIRPLFSPL